MTVGLEACEWWLTVGVQMRLGSGLGVSRRGWGRGIEGGAPVIMWKHGENRVTIRLAPRVRARENGAVSVYLHGKAEVSQ